MTEWTGQRLTAFSERVIASPHVIRLSSGPSGAVAARLPGQSVAGVRIRDDRLEVHVVMAWTSTVDEVELAVASAARATLGADGVVDVVIEDVEHPPGDEDDTELDSSAEAITS